MRTALQFVLALTLSLACLPLQAAEGWLTGLYAQQMALYRLAGTYYMTTSEDADREHIEALPARVADYRAAAAETRKLGADNRLRSQQAATIDEAWKPVEALVTRDIQQVIGTEQKKYINNGLFNAFQRATDVSNALPALERALNQAVIAAGGKPSRQSVMLQSATRSEALATQYARMSTGYFDDQPSAAAAGTPALAQFAREFEGTLASARAQLDPDDAISRMTFERIEARWKFVQPTLTRKNTSRPRVVYRYLAEISDNFLKLAKPRS